MIRSLEEAVVVLVAPRVLWSLFVAAVLVSVTFPLVASYWQLTLLDGISSPAEARAVIEAFTPQQREAHAWITATLDVAYPLTYGCFFAGSALRVFKGYGRLLALPGLLAIPTDLVEGLVQVLALTDTADWLSLKSIVTPAKTALFVSGIVVSAVAWVTWLVRARSGRA